MCQEARETFARLEMVWEIKRMDEQTCGGVGE